MLPATQALWRHLLACSRDDQRNWRSLGALADEFGAGVSSVHKSLALPKEIGAVRVSRRLGVDVLDPGRLITLFVAHRRLARDVLTERVVTAAPQDVEREAVSAGLTVGGFGALVSHLGDNNVASYAEVVVYGPPSFGADLVATSRDDPLATRLFIIEPDRWLPKWQVVPIAQAYADVFCLPSWQAARFIDQIDQRHITAPVESDTATVRLA